MKIETTLEEMLQSYDWREAFAYASPMPVAGYKGHTEPFTRDDVAEVLASAEGENEGPDWIAIFRLNDGRFAFLAAGCDYTGWDCQAGGSAWVASDLESLIQFGVPQEARDRLEAHP
jgi:hypothetical protein